MQMLATATTVFPPGSLARAPYRPLPSATFPFPTPEPTPVSATFIFIGHGIETSAHAFEDEIAVAARGLPGYLGEQSWGNPATGLAARVIYWESAEALDALMRHPAQYAAEAAQGRELDGYRVVVAEVADLGDVGPLSRGGALL
ncbi:antibiotic biosynthesis monooxygenase [Derxia gummosa]|uniref:Antibiotic biosynthesis monooxygenase n=1 Tax=Derxia gummosa DSM 723 TaxID=1121388 RepID=A0A9U5GGU8_9BURK|nr:antibiotic biosynthesis monooxygenase [Derxia gummosa]